MIATIVISCITFLLITTSIIFFPRIKIGKIHIDTYWVIALLGAIILLSFSLSPIKEVWSQLTSNAAINPLKILVLFFSMTLLSIFLDELGLFKYLANKAAKRAKGNQIVLFLILYALTSILTVFTSNDVVILTLTPFICFFAKNAKINPLPYLIAEFAADNTWSMMFVIGNPTNIYLATTAGIDFINYFKVMALPTLCAGIIELLLLLLIFKRSLKEPISHNEEDYVIENKLALIIAVIHLLICLIFLVISSYINIEMWIISLACASSLLIFSIILGFAHKCDKTTIFTSLKRLPYPLIPFFLSMFVIVVGLNFQGVSSQIANAFGNQHVIWIYGYSSFLASNLINNIPMSILYSNLVQNLTETSYIEATYASIIGSNIGAFLTPTGALAGIMFTGLVNKHDIKFTFKNFISYGLIISLPTITIALVMLMVMFL